jgi:hypothetical protein
MKKYLLMFLILIWVLYDFVGCSKSDDSPTESAISPIEGYWQSNLASFVSMNSDTLTINLNLTENNGQISGNGTYTYSKKVNYTYSKVSVTSSITGKLNSTAVSFIIPCSYSKDSCKFSGTFDKANFKMTGMVDIINSQGIFDRSSNLELLKK